MQKGHYVNNALVAEECNLFRPRASKAQQEMLRTACAFAGNRGMAKSGFEVCSSRQHITQQENVQSLLCLSPFCLWVCATNSSHISYWAI